MSTPMQSGSMDARTMMMYEAAKKSMGLAYLLWFFLGGVGGHRYYLGKTSSAVAMTIIFVASLALMAVFVGFLTLLIVGVWALVDAFLIPGWVTEKNQALIAEISG